MTRHAITIRVTDDTLTELHKLTANAKTTAFADVAGEVLDKAMLPSPARYLLVQYSAKAYSEPRETPNHIWVGQASTIEQDKEHQPKNEYLPVVVTAKYHLWMKREELKEAK